MAEERPSSSRTRREDPLAGYAGALTGAFGPDYLESLRCEWPSDADSFREGVDAILDQDPTPHG